MADGFKNGVLNTNLTGILTGNGTGSNATASTVTQNGVLYGGASNAVSSLAVAATGTVMIGNTAAAPSFSATPSVTSITIGGGSALASYVQATSFTPAIAFGGGTTGITYSSQTGSYTRIGNIVFFLLAIVLTNKGSSTGAMTFTGLPITVGSFNMKSVIEAANITFAGNYLVATATGGTTTGTISYTTTAAGTTQLADTNFANNSTFTISGFYFT